MSEDPVPYASGRNVRNVFEYETLFTRKQVAELLQVSQRTIERYEQRGLLPRVELPGRIIRYRPSSVQQFIEGNEYILRPKDRTS